MAHHIDDGAWPLLELTQSGRLTVADATALTHALTAAIGRARDDGHRFVALLDFRDRLAPEKGANGTAAGGGPAGSNGAAPSPAGSTSGSASAPWPRPATSRWVGARSRPAC